MDNQEDKIDWTETSVMITGVCGTVGKELLQQIILKQPKYVLGIDNNEGEIFFASEEMKKYDNVSLLLCDIRDKSKLKQIMRGIDVVIHSAALKNVIVCEESPTDVIHTNITGVQNIIEAAWENKVGRVLFTSSDKAVNPTNVMGTSKLMGERLITAANTQRNKQTDPRFSSTRFGNVLGSRGSVVPIFQSQISKGEPLTVTDPEMTRFIMSVEESAKLVINSLSLAKGGEVFITKMPVIKIIDLAKVMIDELAAKYDFSPDTIDIKVTGLRQGEKMYEELMTSEEAGRTIELDEFLVVLPAFKYLYSHNQFNYSDVIRIDKNRPYNSMTEKLFTQDEIRAYFLKNNLFEV